jgi:hypothetical protein
VPLERAELAGELAEDGIAGGRVCQEDREEADLRRRAGADLAAQADGKELDAEAGAEEGRSGADGLRDPRLLGTQPGKLLLIVDAHRPAHRNDRVELTPVGERIAFIELEAVDLRSALEEHVLVHAGRLTGDVLEDEDLHALNGPPP